MPDVPYAASFRYGVDVCSDERDGDVIDQVAEGGGGFAILDCIPSGVFLMPVVVVRRPGGARARGASLGVRAEVTVASVPVLSVIPVIREDCKKCPL